MRAHVPLMHRLDMMSYHHVPRRHRVDAFEIVDVIRRSYVRLACVEIDLDASEFKSSSGTMSNRVRYLIEHVSMLTCYAHD